MDLLTRSYPVRPRMLTPMLVLIALVPGYLVIAALSVSRTLHQPALALDRLLPVEPAWSLVYLSLYLFWLLPLVVLRDEEQIRRTFWAYVMVWVVAYTCFILYPTTLPRPSPAMIGPGFSSWMLRIVYGADPPYNCFPCLHVAHPVVTAPSCYRVNRSLGLVAGTWAALLAVSTLFTKQHYVADLVVGALLGYAAYLVFLRSCPRSANTELDRRTSQAVVLAFLGIQALTIVGFWVAYELLYGK